MQDTNQIPVDERTRQLERIVDQLQAFVGEQVARWDTVVGCAQEAVATKERARRLLEGIEAEKEAWESERAERVASLETESGLLADAWRRLEAEERRLVAKEAIAETACAGMAAPLDVKQQIAAARASTANDVDELESRIAAVQEFRQLSIEIAKHANRNR